MRTDYWDFFPNDMRRAPKDATAEEILAHLRRENPQPSSPRSRINILRDAAKAVVDAEDDLLKARRHFAILAQGSASLPDSFFDLSSSVPVPETSVVLEVELANGVPADVPVEQLLGVTQDGEQQNTSLDVVSQAAPPDESR